MKYTNGNSSTLFCEQVSTVTSLFEKWNDCERTVVMYALLKRLRYPSLKFLLYSIESNLTQNFNSTQNINLTTLDLNANNPVYLKNLVTLYKTISTIDSNTNTLIDNDSTILYGSNDLILNETDKKYIKKEEILNDILSMLPLLRPGNDEAKSIYLSLIPLAVEDTVKQLVTTELVQQIFSYLLIHPAISNEDRKSLSYWLRHLEDHIQSSFSSSSHQSFYILSSPGETGSKSTSVSSLSSANQNTWQAIAPPSQSQKQLQSHNSSCNKLNKTIELNTSDEWRMSLLKLSDSFCGSNSANNNNNTNNNNNKNNSNNNNNINNNNNNTGEEIQPQIQLNNTGSSQNSLGLIYHNVADLFGNEQSSNSNSNDDHHVSFSKNGTEVYDFSANICDKCHGHIGYSSVLLGNSCEHHLNFSKWNLENKLITTTPANVIKTRRSNSLTTAISSSSSSTSSVITVNENCSNSSENLSQYAQKQRSYSLSIENTRSGLTSSGSDTHLDDFKPNYLKFSSHNIGMSNIGQWLKSLRLHKYVGLFTNTTYEEMLEFTEEYLQSLGVTKGASHKLALCIDKLKERFTNLSKIEQELLSNQITLSAAVEELTNIVLTPMKSVDSTPNNVASKFLQVVDLVSQMITKKEIVSGQDEDCINALLWILERSIHNEAFVAHTNQLKEHKFKVSKLKMQFTPKNHHTKNNNSNLNKPRWNGKNRKNDNSKCGSNDRINRKNSNDALNFSICSLQSQQQQTTIINHTSQYSHEIDNFHSTKVSSSQSQQQFLNALISGNNSSSSNSCPQYKSSSYPNFSNSVIVPSQSLAIKHQHQQQHLQSHQQTQQYRHHRHSFSNLIMVPTTSVQQQFQQQNQIIFKMPNQSINSNNNCNGSNNGVIMNLNKNCSNNSGTSGINLLMDCQNRRSSLSKSIPTTSTTTVVPLTSSSSSVNIGGQGNGKATLIVNQIKENSDVKISVEGESMSMVSSFINANNINNYNNGSSNSNSNNSNKSNINGGNVSLPSSLSLLSSNSITTSSVDDNDKILKNSIGDINSSLEFLCLQMTEQAIN